jgi:hypothetical protein
MKRIFIVLIAGVTLFSCEETVPLDIDQTPSKVVIEGLLTNRPGHNSIKITKTADFYSSGETPRVTNAIVTVTNDQGEVINFVHNPNNHADSAGIYIPSVAFAGEIGRNYNLKVDLDGEIYEAQDHLASVIPLDSLTVRVNEDEQDDPEDEGRIFEVLMFAREPQDENNFYLFKFYRNDSLVFDNDTDIYYSDDELLAEKIDGVPSPMFFKSSEKARVEVYSISRIGYVYYNDLWSLLNNDAGGMFGPIPSSPRTNLSNGALGFFQVSALNSGEVNIE